LGLSVFEEKKKSRHNVYKVFANTNHAAGNAIIGDVNGTMAHARIALLTRTAFANRCPFKVHR